MNLLDTFTLDGVKRTADGYLAAYARVARTGIQIYKGKELGRPDLGDVRVYRPPAEVFHKDALKSFAHRPITLTHPTETVDSKNWKKYAVGHTGEDVARDGESIRVPMLLMDAAAIDAYEKDGVKELSMGYSTDLKWKKGKTQDGETYDAVQTAIRGNHLAMVPVARGGDTLRIGDKQNDLFKDDGTFSDLVRRIEKLEDAQQDCPKCGADAGGQDVCPQCGYNIEDDPENLEDSAALAEGSVEKHDQAEKKTVDAAGISGNHKGERKMRTITLDGVPVDVEDRDATIIQAHLTKLHDAMAAALDAKKKAETDKEEADEEDKETKDGFTKQIEAKDAEIATLKKQLTDSQITPAQLDQMVKDRSDAAVKAKKVLGDKLVTDGKTVEDMQRQVVDAYMGDSAKSWTAEQVAASFNTITADGKKIASGNNQLRDAIKYQGQNGGAADGTDIRDAAFAELEKRSAEAWRSKPGVRQ